MIKLNVIQRTKIDKATLSGSMLIVNKVKFDFNNLSEDSTLPVYKDAEGNIYVTLAVPHNRLFMFRNWGLARWFDKDSNNLIDISEFKVAMDYINETDNVKLKNSLDAIKSEYLLTHTEMEWRFKGKPVA